ncbi:S-methyl-5'-thioadenosine phosphorylase [Candidatus Woesearchaeota archaeon]|nr:S-methyl-5'-thioadenosine phosphorylase [Candidatus Woesearchaeota archaeon]
MIKVGIIGGSGLDNQNILKQQEDIQLNTPYGKPSSDLLTGKINNTEVVILSRHGKDHSIMPTNVPFRANVYALKKLNCSHIIATTAVGSLKKEIKPGDFVFLDQFIDRTTKRHSTFFDKDKVIHFPCSEPFCQHIRSLLSETASELNFSHHKKGTVITIEGPRFSTKAESHLFRQWGADVINMSTVPEVNLAGEARICYASIAMSTDFDCWLETERPVTFDIIIDRMNKNAGNVKKLILQTLPKIKRLDCICKTKISEPII